MTDANESAPGQRRSRTELRELILDAGYEVLRQDGLGLGTEGITYKRVFDYLEQSQGVRVTRGSVHERIWNSQREFQLEVLARAARWDSGRSMGKTAAAVADTLATVELDSKEKRSQALKELIRVGARVNLEASESDALWTLWEGVAAVISVQKAAADEVDGIRQEVSASYRATTNALVEFFNTMISELGLAPRPALGLSHEDAVEKFAMVATALSEGSSLRRRYATDYSCEFDLPTGPNREHEPWDLFSLALWAVSVFFFDDKSDGGRRPESAG